MKKIEINNHLNKNINKSNLSIEDNLEIDTEKLHLYRSNYIIKQKVLDEKKRIILLDWMMEVCSQLGFKRRTYYSNSKILNGTNRN